MRFFFSCQLSICIKVAGLVYMRAYMQSITKSSVEPRKSALKLILGTLLSSDAFM